MPALFRFGRWISIGGVAAATFLAVLAVVRGVRGDWTGSKSLSNRAIAASVAVILVALVVMFSTPLLLRLGMEPHFDETLRTEDRARVLGESISNWMNATSLSIISLAGAGIVRGIAAWKVRRRGT